MPAQRGLEERVAALERRLDDEQVPAASPQSDVESPDTPELQERIDDLESRVAELAAGLQAVRGYVGQVEHVNASVERRADAAIAAVERLESAPKTPPPVATATPADSPPAAAAETGAAEDQPQQDEQGFLERIQSLR